MNILIIGQSNGVRLMRGGPGDDLLSGEQGDDTLRGGAGADILVGDAGADLFVVDEFDTIADFTTGIDRVLWGSVIWTEWPY